MFEVLKKLMRSTPERNKRGDDVVNESRRLRAKLIEETKYLTVQIDESMKIVPIGPAWMEMCDGLKIMLLDSPGDDYTLALVHAGEESTVSPHRHYNAETMYVVSGIHVNSVTGSEHGAGSTIEYAEKELHGSYFPEPTVLLIKWKPSLNEKIMGTRNDFKTFDRK